MKLGDIALINNKLVIIQKIETEEVTTKKKIGGSFFKPIYEDEKTQKTKLVWWSTVGDISQTMKTYGNSANYDWNTLIAEASIIMTQAKIILKIN